MKQQKNDLLIFLGLCCGFAVLWTALNIYHNLATSKIPEVLQTQVTPITPSFDTKTLKAVTERLTVVPNYEVPTTLTTPTPSVGSQATASRSATVTVTPSVSSPALLTPTPVPTQN